MGPHGRNGFSNRLFAQCENTAENTSFTPIDVTNSMFLKMSDSLTNIATQKYSPRETQSGHHWQMTVVGN